MTELIRIGAARPHLVSGGTSSPSNWLQRVQACDTSMGAADGPDKAEGHYPVRWAVSGERRVCLA